ncbi:transcription repressor OFP7-like protein [Tanacetum coccineum]|uniref:Transcription repressor OFP7-like protein n=1 Tax=Tanacetum coccineum TaxID=301880 RepID=A0ABQ5EMM7_9ASTR
MTGDLRGTTLPPPSKQTPCGASTKSHEIASFERGKIRRINKCRCADERALSRPHKGRDGEVSPLWRSPARLSEFKKQMMWKVEGKVKESYVEVKRSQNPIQDFTKSMLELIVYHHGMIMEAFLDIWRTMVFNH